MLHQDKIAYAVKIQKQSYKLLRWLAEAIDSEFISISRAHDYASASDAAYEWIKEHYQNIPQECRPAQDCMRDFSNYFGSYVTTSFDFVSDPLDRAESSSGCFCPGCCARLVKNSHLQPKRLSKRDKNQAIDKCADRVLKLAEEENLLVTPETARAIATSPTLKRSAAYSAYGKSLLDRIKNSEGNSSILVLWRMIAWKPEGSPIKGFTLHAEDIYNAEHELVAALARDGEH